MKLLTLSLLTIMALPACKNEQKQEQKHMKQASKVELTSPEDMHKNPAFSQLAIVEGPVRTIYIGGQDAVDKEGNIVGKGDLEAQTKQVLANIELALKAGGASLDHVVKWNLYVVQGQSLQNGYKVFQERMGHMKKPPLISMCFVQALANPDFLLEMDAMAMVPID